MPFQACVTVHPDSPNAFQSGSFGDLLQRPILLPGLDPSWTHTLIAVAVAADGDSAELTVHSEPAVALSLDRSLRIVNGTPAASVRTVDTAGAVLAESTYPAPLREGQEVEIGGSHYTVLSVDWPGRHPEHGVCVGEVDWQVAVVVEAPRPPALPTPAVA